MCHALWHGLIPDREEADTPAPYVGAVWLQREAGKLNPVSCCDVPGV